MSLDARQSAAADCDTKPSFNFKMTSSGWILANLTIAAEILIAEYRPAAGKRRDQSGRARWRALTHHGLTTSGRILSFT